MNPEEMNALLEISRQQGELKGVIDSFASRFEDLWKQTFGEGGMDSRIRKIETQNGLNGLRGLKDRVGGVERNIHIAWGAIALVMFAGGLLVAWFKG